MSEFTAVLALDELEVGAVVAVEVDGTAVALARTPEGVFAIEDRCSHQDVPLSEGEVVDCTLECWLHGSAFDLRTGSPLGPPAVTRVPTYPTRIQQVDGVAMIEVCTVSNSTQHSPEGQ
jgi:3-phenylpropionate/trans-cinnamate dioxygenase ferredoxin subunit